MQAPYTLFFVAAMLAQIAESQPAVIAMDADTSASVGGGSNGGGGANGGDGPDRELDPPSSDQGGSVYQRRGRRGVEDHVGARARSRSTRIVRRIVRIRRRRTEYGVIILRQLDALILRIQDLDERLRQVEETQARAMAIQTTLIEDLLEFV